MIVVGSIVFSQPAASDWADSVRSEAVFFCIAERPNAVLASK